MTLQSNVDGSDLEPGQSVTWLAQYRHWQAYFAPPPVDAGDCTYHPTFALVVDAAVGSQDALLTTLGSLRAQTYAEWQAWVLREGRSSPAGRAEDERVELLSCDGPDAVAPAIRRRLEASSCDFVAYVPAGDELKPDALAAIVVSLNEDGAADALYTDRDQRASDGQLTLPFFKPAWSPALLTSMDYVSGLAVYQRDAVLNALDATGIERNALGYELALRVTSDKDSIRHVEGPYYTVANGRADDSGAVRSALEKALVRRGETGRVVATGHPGIYQTRPALKGHPKVTIIIPTRDRLELVKASVESVRTMTTYDNYEIMLIDNESLDPATLQYMAEHDGPAFRYPHPFNYARMMNLAAWEADAPYIVFLNNDTEIISPDWLEGLLEQCQEPDVGIVGTRLLHPDGSVHHEGITLWRHGVTVAHIWFPGYHGLGYAVREVAAVTGACLMARSSAFREIDGFDERMVVGYNDVDLCMRMRARGYRVIQAGNVELYHVAGASRGRTTPLADELFFLECWPPEATRDPYFPDNLTATWPVAILPP